MRGFGVHTAMWTLDWTPANAERAVTEASRYAIEFIEIALLDPPGVDAGHSRRLLEKHGLRAVCSLGLPAGCWPSRDPRAAVEFLKVAVDKTVAIGAEALSGVTYGGIGERTGKPPTRQELDNVARVLGEIAGYAKQRGIALGIEPVNRYETHLINTGWQAAAMVEQVGSENLFIHLDTYHMNIEEKGAANGILAAREHLRYIHLSESDRGVPGAGTCDWDEIHAALAAVGFQGGLAMESFIELPPQIAAALSVWRPVADSATEVMDRGLPFLQNKARQYGLMPR